MATTAVDRAEDEPELALRVNAEAPAELVHWAARQDVPLIHFSTDYVFEGSGETFWREEDACRPLSSYGRSKWEGEKAIQADTADFFYKCDKALYGIGLSREMEARQLQQATKSALGAGDIPQLELVATTHRQVKRNGQRTTTRR